LFIGFGPAEDPVLAVAVVAENGEHGSKMAPIARKLIQRYMEKYTAVTSRHKASSKEVISGLNDGAAHTAHNSHNH